MAKKRPSPVEPVLIKLVPVQVERESALKRLDELVPGNDESVREFLDWVRAIQLRVKSVAMSWLSVEDARRCDIPSKHVRPLLLDLSQAAEKLLEVARQNRLGCFGEDVIVRVAKPLAALIVAAEKLASDARDSTAIDELTAASCLLERETHDAMNLAGSQVRRRKGQRGGKADPRIKRKRMSRDVANAQAMKLAHADTSFAKAPTVRRWAKEIGCSTGLVGKLPFWLKCQKRLGKSDRPKKAKAVALTDVLAATIGQMDPELERLLAEQAADHEPSPLDSSPHRARSRRPSV